MNSNSDVPVSSSSVAGATTTTLAEFKNSQNNITTTSTQHRNSYGAPSLPHPLHPPQHPTTLGDLYHTGSTVTSTGLNNNSSSSSNNRMTATVDVGGGGGVGVGAMAIVGVVPNATTATKTTNSSTSSSMHDYDNRQSINNGAASLSGLMVASCGAGVGVGGMMGGIGSKPQERYVWEMRARSPNVTPASTVLNSPDLNTDMQYSIHPHQRQLQQIRVGRSPGSQFEQHNILPQVGGNILYFKILVFCFKIEKFLV